MDRTRTLIVSLTSVLCILKFGAVSCYVYTNEIYLPQGILRGIVSWPDHFNAYLGVPYASVSKRYQEAGPPSRWNGTFYAINGSVKCNQYFSILKNPIGREDCLVSNIYTPIDNRDKLKLLPVMVFIHGGGYITGSNTNLIYNPRYLIEKRVVVVTINYRLGAFGFLCLQTREAPGNIGLKDQIAALHWIKNNIAAFGGNPDAITVFGESAGASSVHYLIMTGAYKGLFNKAIMESGSILMTNKFDKNPIKSAASVASRMGYKTSDPNELLNIFLNSTADQIIEATHVSTKNDPMRHFIFKPCIESDQSSLNPLLTTNPRNLLRKTKLDSDLIVIVGYNNKEGINSAGKFDSEGLQKLNNDFDHILPENIMFTDRMERSTLSESVKKFYFKDGIIRTDNYEPLVDYYSDTYIIYPSVVSTEFFLSSNVSVYNYYFKYDSKRNIYKFMSGLPSQPGANHADELFYIFEPIIYNLLPSIPSDLEIIDTITTLWTNFAKIGKPTFDPKGVQWFESSKEELKFLQLDKKVKMISLPDKERVQFWSEVYHKYDAY